MYAYLLIVIRRFCGEVIPDPIVIPGTQVLIGLVTNNDTIVGRGFELQYRFVGFDGKSK